ncbi:hypothetical protein Tco_0074940 [Tanacetum coccineum]
MDLKTQLKTVAKNHQASIQNLETKFDRLADKQSGRPSGSFTSNTQPNLQGNNSKAYQPPQSLYEYVNAVFTRSCITYGSPVNPNDQQNNSKIPINFDRDDEDDEPTLKPKLNLQNQSKKHRYPNHRTKNPISSTPKKRKNGGPIWKIPRRDPSHPNQRTSYRRLSRNA